MQTKIPACGNKIVSPADNICKSLDPDQTNKGAQCLSGRVLDLRQKGCVVSLSKTH